MEIWYFGQKIWFGEFQENNIYKLICWQQNWNLMNILYFIYYIYFIQSTLEGYDKKNK